MPVEVFWPSRYALCVSS